MCRDWANAATCTRTCIKSQWLPLVASCRSLICMGATSCRTQNVNDRKNRKEIPRCARVQVQLAFECFRTPILAPQDRLELRSRSKYICMYQPAIKSLKLSSSFKFEAAADYVLYSTYWTILSWIEILIKCNFIIQRSNFKLQYQLSNVVCMYFKLLAIFGQDIILATHFSRLLEVKLILKMHSRWLIINRWTRGETILVTLGKHQKEENESNIRGEEGRGWGGGLPPVASSSPSLVNKAFQLESKTNSFKRQHQPICGTQQRPTLEQPCTSSTKYERVYVLVRSQYHRSCQSRRLASPCHVSRSPLLPGLSDATLV